MEDKVIQLVSEVLDEYILARDTIIKENTDLIEKEVQYLTDLNNQVITAYISVKEEVYEENRTKGFAPNLFQILGATETKHSRFLAYLLKPKESHGQGTLFLDLFLDHFAKDFPKENRENWNVWVEIAYVDILITYTNPNICIIIENKAFKARDQQNQMYRYWFEHIFLPNQPMGYKELLKNKEHFKMFYLHPDKTPPTENSLQKPESDEYEPYNLPGKLEENDIHIIDFKKDIKSWFKSCLKSIPETN